MSIVLKFVWYDTSSIPCTFETPIPDRSPMFLYSAVNNFENFWNVSCLSDFSGVWHILNFTVIFCCVSFNFFDGTCSLAWFLRMRKRRFGGSGFKSGIYVHFSFERFFSWVRVEVVPTVWCAFSEWFPPN